MHARHHPSQPTGPALPRWALQSAFLGLGLLLLAVLGLRLSGYQPGETVQPPVAERALRFSDGPDGSVRVQWAQGPNDSEAGDDPLLSELRGEQGFLRGVLRGVARDRRARDLPLQAPLMLSLHRDGRLLLTDPLSGQRIDLISFGPDNAAVFRRWLPGAVSPQADSPAVAGVPQP
jgi:putative photosynthetic complex assembly protein